MNDQPQEPENSSHREELEARVLAMLLGEADAAERAEIESLLVKDSELRAYREQMEQTLGLVGEASQSLWPTEESAAPKLSEDRRTAIRKAWSGKEPALKQESAKPFIHKVHPLIPLGLAAGFAILLGAVWLPKQLKNAEADKVAFRADLPAVKQGYVGQSMAPISQSEGKSESSAVDRYYYGSVRDGTVQHQEGRDLSGKERVQFDRDGDGLADSGKDVGKKNKFLQLNGDLASRKMVDSLNNGLPPETPPTSDPEPGPEPALELSALVVTNTLTPASDEESSETNGKGKRGESPFATTPPSQQASALDDLPVGTPVDGKQITIVSSGVVLVDEAGGQPHREDGGRISKLKTNRANAGNRFTAANEARKNPLVSRQPAPAKNPKAPMLTPPPPANLTVADISVAGRGLVPVQPASPARPKPNHFRLSGGNAGKEERERELNQELDLKKRKQDIGGFGWVQDKQGQVQQAGERADFFEFGKGRQLEEQAKKAPSKAGASARPAPPLPAEAPMPKSAKPQKALALGGIGGGSSRPFSGIVEGSKSSSSEKKKLLPDPSGLDLDSVRELPPEVVLKTQAEALPDNQRELLRRLQNQQAEQESSAKKVQSTDFSKTVPVPSASSAVTGGLEQRQKTEEKAALKLHFGNDRDKPSGELNDKRSDALLERLSDEKLESARHAVTATATRAREVHKSLKDLEVLEEETRVTKEKLAVKGDKESGSPVNGLLNTVNPTDPASRKSFADKDAGDDSQSEEPRILIAGIAPAVGSTLVPNDADGDEKESDYGINVPVQLPDPKPEVVTAENRYSTFSLNVSDASFRLSQASLRNGQLPPPHVVRAEEFINAFDYRDPAPAKGIPLAFAWERSRHPFAHNRDLVRFSIQTAAEGREGGQALNLVLAIDNSGSMERADRVAILREALKVLASKLRAGDTVSVIAFSRTPRLWLDGLKGEDARRRLAAFNGLVPQGGTNIESALNLGYATALKHFISGGNNRVILLTDGAANLGAIIPNNLRKKVETFRKRGVALDCFGIGWDGYNDHLMEALARNGDGRYAFLNSAADVERDFARKLAGAFSVSAADVKVQVVFNPDRVKLHRQVGYLRHQLKKEDFRNNTVDAAEIGAAESGNAVYVLQVNEKGTGPLGRVHIRYRQPATGEYKEMSWDLPHRVKVPALADATPAMRLAAAAAAFAEWLGRSPFAADVELPDLQKLTFGLEQEFPSDSPVKAFQQMIVGAHRLMPR